MSVSGARMHDPKYRAGYYEAEAEIQRARAERAETQRDALREALRHCFSTLAWCSGRLEVSDGSVPLHVQAAMEHAKKVLDTPTGEEP